ncbi:MAG: SAM-dependent chlorinase/fluorinase [Bacteroidales bacterium]|nr:SAM-dependent chlorinase/fluorinase [Bacteroidales bacterium]
MESPIITLTTDWGDSDFFAAAVKGRLYSMIPGVKVVDLSHRQNWNDITVTSSLIRHGCMSFPEKTIHFVDVCCGQAQLDGSRNINESKPVLALYNGHYFICNDRRVLEQSFDSDCTSVVELEPSSDTPSNTFLAAGLFCDVARRISDDETIEAIGTAAAPIRHRTMLKAVSDGNRIEARVSSIDSYGNVNFNITHTDFENIRAGRRFRVELEWRSGSSDRYESIVGVSRNYNEVRVGSLLLTVSSTGQMQLAVNRGSAAQLLGLCYTSRCIFTFIG